MEQEERALAGVAGQLRTTGRDLVQKVVDRGAAVAGDALGAAKDSAQAHGLTPDKPVGELLGERNSGELLGHARAAARTSPPREGQPAGAVERWGLPALTRTARKEQAR